MSFSLRQIQYFVAVAENGSVSRAAHQLSVSQSTITEAVQELERDLGLKLMERQARGVALTHKGHHFLRHATKILADVADARRALAEDRERVTGAIHVGVTSLVAGYVLSDLLARFRRAYPAVEVSAVEDNRDYLEHLLVNGELDVAVVVVVADRGDQGALQAEILEVSPYRLWLPLGHRLAAEAEISLAEIAQERQVALSIDEIEQTAEAYWRRHGGRPTVAFRTRSVEAVRSLVATGAGLAILPDLLYRPWSLEGDRIEARPIAEALPTVQVGIVWRRGSTLPQPARNFIEIARNQRLMKGRG
ncbi:LysR family transcriptional regulator [Oleomonas cavernae]|uniref:LysR family transcriptional regulator n=1 Tax=Oleomonas cavernae TaxID=2320859 RepID=A0A418WFC4_9PROT|nr:LysR family transcriptional regulator [Oleomonas cavernae]RJF88682.1 LysR family transcriptional regulator [Oleomonas cavernae]